MKRVAATGLVALALFLYGLSLSDTGAPDAAGALRASLSLAPAADTPTGFRQAAGPRAWRFPADFGPRPAFGSEWWYYTGQLDSEDGRRFGYQFTLFRRATAPTSPASASEWRDNQFYMGHFSISDVAGGRFLHEQRLSRAGAGLAGAVGAPRVHIWLEDLDMLALDDEVRRLRLRANMAGAAIDFTLERTNPPLLRGNGGHSQKGRAADEASFYYSIPRLTTRGVLTLDGERIGRWQSKPVTRPVQRIGDRGETVSHFHLGPEGWVDVPDSAQILCYNEIATKMNWSYLRVDIDLATQAFLGFQCDEQRYPPDGMQVIKLPPMPNLFNMLNIAFWVEADAARRCFLYVDSCLLSAAER